MKLFNVIVIHDMFVVAETPEAAQEALLANIALGEAKPTEQVVIETTNERAIRESWQQEAPFVGADISDEDFATLKGKKTLAIFKQLYTKDKPT